MESSRSSTQTMTTTSSSIVETFVEIPFVVASEMGIYFLVKKIIVHNFLRIPQSTFPLLQFRVERESSRSSTQTMTTTSSYIVETFVYLIFVEALEMGIYLLVQKTIVHNFFGFSKVRFLCYSPQFKWNQVVLLLKQWRQLLLTSLRLSFKYHL